ncbi:MAG: hypothetical protein ACEPOV_10155 [Hyphomicrobiales bacterium]
MKKISILLALLLAVNIGFACTTAVISGKATPDGRPLLWKLRDTETFENKLKYFDDGKYSYIGLINSDDAEGKQVWSGSNNAGFAIMNSASFNLRAKDDTTSYRDREGIVIKEALMQCATVDEFEAFLKNYPKPMGVEANFGVIDAKGNAAYFETSDNSYTKFDANDPIVAPNGYIIRTNYSFTGKPNVGYGFIRFQTTQDLFYTAAGENKIDLNFILRDVSRSQYNALTQIDLYDELPQTYNENYYRNNQDCIVRYGTTNSMVIQGVKKNEDPALTTLWTILGNPLSAVAIPTWVTDKVELPVFMTAEEDFNSPSSDKSLQLCDEIFYPIKRGSGKAYVNFSKLANKENNGIVQKLLPVEKKVLTKSNSMIDTWRSKNKVDVKEMKEFYQWIDQYMIDSYRKLFDI